MKFNPHKHHRRSIRLPDHDYSRPGSYFITMITRGREPLFGEIHDGAMHLNDAGQIVWEMWNSLSIRYPQIGLGTAVVMPDHFHGILIIHPVPVRAIHESPLPERDRRRMLLPLAIGYFKMNSAKRINKILGSVGMPVWQRNYYEHVIRSDEEHQRIHSYIESNVSNWSRDDNYFLKRV